VLILTAAVSLASSLKVIVIVVGNMVICYHTIFTISTRHENIRKIFLHHTVLSGGTSETLGVLLVVL
jgi:hypothetical protein